jgi:L-seryl-tRNA(Ser) seleniumtransferase
MDLSKKEYLRRLTSVNDLLQAFNKLQAASEDIPREIVVEAIRNVVDGVRQAIQTARDEVELQKIKTGVEDLLPRVEEEVRQHLLLHLRRLINATGVVLHTNLGRSLLPEEALNNLKVIGGNYSNLELDLERGVRGSRHAHVEDLLCRLTGAESAMVVNNNAGAVLLALITHAQGREVIVSRGQLIEIGGSFRLPEVMKQSGAILVEVGTTNKTYIEDYARAITENTAMLLRAHPSNYRVVGFTASASLKELGDLSAEKGLILMDDLGSGVLIDLSKYGLPYEPTPAQSLREGADLVSFSGDKLLGGPQAGIVVGRRDLVEEMARHPLARALRIDKLTLAALEATLKLYLEPEKVLDKIPTLKMLTLSPAKLRRRARALASQIEKACPSLKVSLSEDYSQAGGGSLPLAQLPTWVVSIESDQITANQLEELLRKNEPPIIARIKEDRLLLDLRTLRKEDIPEINQAFERISSYLEG